MFDVDLLCRATMSDVTYVSSVQIKYLVRSGLLDSNRLRLAPKRLLMNLDCVPDNARVEWNPNRIRSHPNAPLSRSHSLRSTHKRIDSIKQPQDIE